ncbi:MAG: DUF2384 domain-containing protein [Spirochaetales bacterium]|nr:DUF2384 domain-containing protein [Spirochaetales bacterium]
MSNALPIEEMFGGYKVLGHRIDSEMDMYEIGRYGISKKALLVFARSIGMSVKALAAILNITERTLQRKKDPDLLNERVSEHVLQLAEVYARGEEVFDGIDDFRTWLNVANRTLDGKKPLEMLSSRYGAQMVLDELGRIEYGVIS